MTRFQMKRFQIRGLAVVLAAALVTSAHVGSPDVWFDGDAGPYTIRVLIRPPEVVPGLADIGIRVDGGADRVTVAPARSGTGEEGQPAPDVALPDPDNPGWYGARLWLMERGAYRIVIRIEGARGVGEAIVPVTATAMDRQPMSAGRSAVLLGAAAFLVAGLISIIGAAARESVLPPGTLLTAERRRRARLAMAGGGVAVALVLFGGWRWWADVDANHRARLDRRWSVESAVAGGVLRVSITEPLWRSRGQAPLVDQRGLTPIVPDHGKLMHLFLVRNDQRAFAHVHPSSDDQNEFRAALPALPAGNYRVYAEVVHQSGFTRTLTDTLFVPDTPGSPALDPEDAGWTEADDAGDPAPAATAPGGSAPPRPVRLHWLGPTRVRAGQPIELAVQARDAGGAPAPLQPYMGMAGHAVVERDDGQVFIHLHPLGTISVAARLAVTAEAARGAAPGDAAHAGHDPQAGPSMAHGASDDGRLSSEVRFPYAFPSPGRYRIWVQARAADVITTAAFDVDVEP